MILGGIVSLVGIVLLTHLADNLFISIISWIIQRPSKPTWPRHLQTAGIGLILFGGIIILVALFIFPRLVDLYLVTEKKFTRLEDRIETGLSRYISFDPPSESSLKKSQSIQWVDIVVGLLFLAAALFIFLGKIQGDYPHILMGSDAHNIISFAAALDHPENYKGDALLNNLDNFSIYSTINIPIIRWLNRFTGDYSLAFSYLLIPQLFIQFLGFYLLGVVLFKNRSWAFLFTLLVSMPFDINLNETWGISLDPVSRFTFQAFLPFLLLLAYQWRNTPRRWPWIMLLTGLLVFVHPVSTPAWGIALWLGFIPFLPQDWKVWKRLVVMLGLGLLFLAAASPFILNYMSHHVQGKSADYKLVYHIILTAFPPNLLNVPAAILDFLTIMLKSGALPASMVGFLILWLLLRHDRGPLTLMLVWIVGIILASVLLPWLEQSIERFYHIIPVETELVRGIRYLVFFMLILCLWPLAELSKRFRPRIAAGIAITCGILLTGIWMISYHPNLQVMAKALDCLKQGHLVCVSLSDEATLIDAIRNKTPQDAHIFTTFSNGSTMSFSLPIRSTALRSLVYSFKDRGMMVYSNTEALNAWYATYLTIEQIRSKYYGDYMGAFRSYMNLATDLGANYLIINVPPPPKLLQKYPIDLIYQNTTYTLFLIKPPPQ